MYIHRYLAQLIFAPDRATCYRCNYRYGGDAKRGYEDEGAGRDSVAMSVRESAAGGAGGDADL